MNAQLEHLARYVRIYVKITQRTTDKKHLIQAILMCENKSARRLFVFIAFIWQLSVLIKCYMLGSFLSIPHTCPTFRPSRPSVRLSRSLDLTLIARSRSVLAAYPLDLPEHPQEVESSQLAEVVHGPGAGREQAGEQSGVLGHVLEAGGGPEKIRLT